MFRDIPSASGIYKITCTVTGLIYIGSAIDFRIRWNNHFNTLQRNDHDNSKLQHAWNKYGKDAFTFEILEYILPMSLTAREQYWFDKLKPFDKRGFNINRIAGSTLGAECTQQTRDKISAKNKGRKSTEEAIRSRAEGHRGIKRNPDAIQRASLKRIGTKHTPQALANCREAKRHKMKALIVTSPDGVEYSIVGIHQFCKEHQLDRSTLLRVAKGLASHHKGWKARFYDAI